MTSDDIARRLRTEADFVNIKRLGYSLEKLMERYPDGVPDKVIASALGITEDEVEILYASTVELLQKSLKITPL
jgi:hypothetical protein